MNALNILGAGGHAKVVVDTARACGRPPKAIFDDQPAGRLLGLDVHGPLDACADDEDAVVAVGNNRIRKEIVTRIALPWTTLVHPRAIVSDAATLGQGSVVFAGAVIQPDASIGDHVIVNTGALIDHDCRLEDYSQVSPGVALAGNVRVGEGAFLGTGASVRPGIQIGAWAYVGAGAVVVADVPAGATVVGNPARPLRTETIG